VCFLISAFLAHEILLHISSGQHLILKFPLSAFKFHV
jgi:hypothetical protein